MFSAPVSHVAHQIPKGNKFFLVPIASVCCVCVCVLFFFLAMGFTAPQNIV